MATGEWRSLSRRFSDQGDDSLYGGVPGHLSAPLQRWCANVMNYSLDAETVAEVIALKLRISPVRSTKGLAHSIILAVRDDEDRFLDVVDALLFARQGSQWQEAAAGSLKTLLSLAGSAWTVSAGGGALVERVSDAEKQAYEAAVEPGDAASSELATAWAKIYGLSPDPSDAWDHAIKAVEEVLSPVVAPGQRKPTLGTLVARLGEHADTFDLRLSTSSSKTSDVEALIQVIRLMWPNPDRHGGGAKRTPTSEESVDVVQLAVAIVGWMRNRALTMRTVSKT